VNEENKNGEVNKNYHAEKEKKKDLRKKIINFGNILIVIHRRNNMFPK
jgi:hypothetical protein